MPKGASWKTSSGKLDDFDMTIEDAFFGTDPNYRKGTATVFIVRGAAEIDGEVVDDEYKMFYSVGEGWEAHKGGRALVHGSGKESVNRSSNMGKLIDAVAGLGDEVIEELMERGEATEADTWEGLRFHFQNKTYPIKDSETGEISNYDVSLPTEYLGVDETNAKPKAKTATKGARGKGGGSEEAAPKARSRKTADKPADKPAARSRSRKPEPEPVEEDDDLRAAVVEFAAEFAEDAHELFIQAVYDPEEFPQADDIDEDEDLAAEVMDPDSELWAEAHAG